MMCLGFTMAAAAQTESVLYSFTGGVSGSTPYAALTYSNGHWFGTASSGGTSGNGIVFELTPQDSGEWEETVIYNFAGGRSDGSNPQQQMTADADGNLFGVTAGGGWNDTGTVFELSPSNNGWQETVLHSFAPPNTGQNQNDGSDPQGPLTFDAKGHLFGTTEYGGNALCFEGCGVVYEMSKVGDEWKERVIFSFAGQANGNAPEGHLVFDDSGNLYGTTATGGAQIEGTVYELSPQPDGTWTETLLHSFATSAGGNTPVFGLIRDPEGNLYGDADGSANNTITVFELTPSSGGAWTYHNLYNFIGEASGSFPSSGLTRDSNGNLFGESSGDPDNAGVIWEVTPSSGEWTGQVVYTFPSSGTSGDEPSGGLVLGPNATLYGTTEYGGSSIGQACYPGCGTVFRVTY